MSRARLLLVIPDDDISLELFYSEALKNLMDVEAIPYQSTLDISDKIWDFIYIRGPFVQADFDNSEIKEAIDAVLRNNKEAYVVDSLKRFSDFLLEDKWRQFELFPDIMPHTEPIDSFKNLNVEGKIIKKRISGRSRDIHFDVKELAIKAKPENYILQQRLDIKTEYRAFMVGGELILPLEIKSSKTEKTKNKVIGLEKEAPEEVKRICRQVHKRLRFDFMGLDIAKTDDGYYLLEVNRSPQFINFLKITSINLAKPLFKYLHSIEKSN
jgi:hypothetical protein